MTTGNEALKQAKDEQKKDFSSILKKLSSIDEKQRQLWLEIYNNAVGDRQKAFAVFEKLLLLVDNSSSEYAVHGKTLSNYLERMNKCNDQLLKLSELITHAEEEGGKIDPDEVFDKIRS
jgi:hypothetical protein